MLLTQLNEETLIVRAVSCPVSLLRLSRVTVTRFPFENQLPVRPESIRLAIPPVAGHMLNTTRRDGERE